MEKKTKPSKKQILEVAESLIGKGSIILYLLFMQCYLNKPNKRRTGLETLGMAAHIFTDKTISIRFTGESYEGWYKGEEGTTQFVLRENRKNSNDIWTSDYKLKHYSGDIIDIIENLPADKKRVVNAYKWIHDNFVDIVEIYARSKNIKKISEFKHKEMREYLTERFGGNKQSVKHSNNTEEKVQAPSNEKVEAVNSASLNSFRSAMELAHHIRRTEKLEGHYHAQMKYALKKAHEILNNETQEKDYDIIVSVANEYLKVTVRGVGSKAYIMEHKTKEEIYKIAKDKYVPIAKSKNKTLLITYDKIPC